MEKLYLLFSIIFLYQFVQAEEQSKCGIGFLEDSKGGCIAHLLEDSVADEIDCEYVEGKKEVNESANVVAKCGFNGLSGGDVHRNKCGLVDSRCRATVRCYPTRVGFGAGSNYGINLPAFELSAECPAVDGKCPENPNDCLKNNDIRIAIDNDVDVRDREELYNEVIPQSQNRGGGVR